MSEFSRYFIGLTQMFIIGISVVLYLKSCDMRNFGLLNVVGFHLLLAVAAKDNLGEKFSEL